MLKSRKIAITGLPAAGKTTVCRLFEALGAYVVDTDKIVHQFLSPTHQIGQKVILLLGEEIVVEGRIDRERVANQVFSNPSLLKKLEGIIHPEVQKELDNKYLDASNKNYTLFIAEVPLLFEGGFEVYFDQVITVVADERECEKRMKKKQFQTRRARMLSQDEKARRADFVIENNGSMVALETSVKTLFNQLKKT